MTKEVLAKLEDAFSVGASDKEAYFIAGISKDAFYDYCKENPEFTERKEALKDMPKYKARKNIVEAIESKNIPVSQWYAERKAKDEFSQRTEQTGADGGPIQVEDTPKIKELTQQLNEIYRGRSIGSDGKSPSPLGDKTPDKE